MSQPLALSLAPPEAGGKAERLGQMLRAGLPVPEGWVVLSGQSAEEVVQAWQAAGAPSVAVRSSSRSEDQCSQSLAGRFETELAVRDIERLRCALQRIGASLDGSVIVQPMVEARASGVIFTQDPTGSEPGPRIEVHAGRGDELVSGRVRPLPGDQLLPPKALEELLELAQRARTLFGQELDLEFVLDPDQRLWLLQARPITSSQSLREQLRQREIERARQMCGDTATLWARHNLAESLPHPLPLSWSLVRDLLSLDGAYGPMYRQLGYDPDPEVGSVLDLIAGRPYTNLSRSARLYFRHFPFAYSAAQIRAGELPPPAVDLQRAPTGFWRHLPATVFKMIRAEGTLRKARRDFPQQFREQIAPAYRQSLQRCAQDRLEDLSKPVLLERIEQLRQGLFQFASQSLKAAAFAGLGSESQPTRLDPECDVQLWLGRAAAGDIGLSQLLEKVGHRGPLEMELAEPRWSERPERLQAQLNTPQATPADSKLTLWLALREEGRHWLMLGWAELRRTLLALDRVLDLGGDIFWLHLEELLDPPLAEIPRRKQEWALLRSLPCPALLCSDDLEALGRPLQLPPGQTQLQGTGLSWGVAEGEALLIHHPDEVPPDARGFVLICPSTDPGYAAAMGQACALIVETGGVLSHGAIVARELGLPAVANLPMAAFRSGIPLRVNGQQGLVDLL